MSWLLPNSWGWERPPGAGEAVVSGITAFGCEGSLDGAGEKAEVRGRSL
jgi:hypothetical protein